MFPALTPACVQTGSATKARGTRRPRRNATLCPLTDLPDELHFDALVLQPLVGVLEGEDHPPGDGLPVVEEEIFLLLAFLRLVLHPPPALGIAQHQLQLRALPEPEEAHGSERGCGPAGTTDRARPPRPRGCGAGRGAAAR